MQLVINLEHGLALPLNHLRYLSLISRYQLRPGLRPISPPLQVLGIALFPLALLAANQLPLAIRIKLTLGRTRLINVDLIVAVIDLHVLKLVVPFGNVGLVGLQDIRVRPLRAHRGMRGGSVEADVDGPGAMLLLLLFLFLGA